MCMPVKRLFEIRSVVRVQNDDVFGIHFRSLPQGNHSIFADLIRIVLNDDNHRELDVPPANHSPENGTRENEVNLSLIIGCNQKVVSAGSRLESLTKAGPGLEFESQLEVPLGPKIGRFGGKGLVG